MHHVAICILHTPWFGRAGERGRGNNGVVGNPCVGKLVNGRRHFDDGQCHAVGHGEGKPKSVICVFSGSTLGGHQIGGRVGSMGALVILRLPRVDERSEERHVRQSRPRRDGSGFAVHVRLIRVVEVVVFIRQPAGKHCSIIGFPDDIARGCIPLGSQFHVGIDHLGAPHHIGATGIACREFCCIVLFHGAGGGTGIRVGTCRRNISAVSNGNGELLRLVLDGRKLFFCTGGKQQE